MEWLPVNVYVNYIDAHIAKGVLAEEGIETWLRDENTVTIDPILTNAVGGIKLMVPKEELQRAWEILNKLNEEQKEKVKCPKCSSNNIEFVSTPRKPINWFMAFFVSTPNSGFDKVNHCFDCGSEFPYEYRDE
jgi:Putative prokaryotic signal transducing protein